MKTKFFVFFIMAAFGSKGYENDGNHTKSGEKTENKSTENSIVVKIEESEYCTKKVTSDYIGVSFNEKTSKWRVYRRSKSEKKMVYNGYYDNEVTAAHASDTVARKLIKKSEHGHKLNFPADYTEVHPEERSSKYIGVSYIHKHSKWRAERWSKNEKHSISNGWYEYEKTAALASDTLAKNLMAKGEKGHKLNFPDDNTEVNKKKNTSEYIGVAYNKRESKWCVQRWSKQENKLVSYGYYDNDKTAAHASDTLVRKLIGNGEQGHTLNFPDDETEVLPKEKKYTSKYIGVNYTRNKWSVKRWSREEKKLVFNGQYTNEKTAALASDTLARQLMNNGEHGHRLNFPDDNTEVHPRQYQKKKRKRQDNSKDN